MRLVIRSEWVKLRTMPSMAWLIGSAIVLTIAAGSAITSSVNVKQCPTPDTCFEDTIKLSLMGVRLGQIIVVVLAVLIISNEYGTRLIEPTLLATPQRWKVLMGKLVTVATLGLLIGALSVGGSLWASRNILPGNGFGPINGYPMISLENEATRRAAVGSVLYLGLVAILAFGLGLIIRDTAGALTATVGLLFLPAIAGGLISNPVWQQRLDKYSPMTAGLAVQSTRALESLAVTPWGGIGILALWAAGALTLGAAMLLLRDA